MNLLSLNLKYKKACSCLWFKMTSVHFNKNTRCKHLLDSLSFTATVCVLLQQLSLTCIREKFFRHIINLKDQYLVDLQIPYCRNFLSIFHPEATILLRSPKEKAYPPPCSQAKKHSTLECCHVDLREALGTLKSTL